MDFETEDNWDEFPGIRERKISWKKTQDIIFLYHAKVDDENWRLRINRFPDEPFYTLIIDGREILHFNNWPSDWQKGD